MVVPIHKVFVSSTYEDLREERSEVQKALLKLGCFPVGMELFPSADDDTWNFIKRQIVDSDYYIAIIAGRYGSTASDGVSWTEKEYEYAREVGLPSIAFVHGEPDSIPVGKTDQDPEKTRKLFEFSDRVRRRPIATFRSPHELAKEVLVSIVNLRERNPKPGYVRANEAADLRKYAELLEENSRLKEQIARTREDAIFERASEAYTLTVTVRTSVSKPPGPPVTISREFPLGTIFIAVAHTILDRTTDADVLPHGVVDRLFPDIKEGRPDPRELSEILMIFFGTGLLSYDDEEKQQGPFAHRHRYWKLTPVGQKQFGLLRLRGE